MPYQNDTATLADIVSPAYAAMQVGISNDNQNAQDALKLQTQQATQPADIQKPYLANLYQGALTGDVNAKTQAQDLTNQFTQQTQPGAIQAANAKSQTEVGASQMQRLQQLGGLAGQVAGYMDQIPAPARPAAMQQLLQSNGIDPSKLGVLANGDPDMLRNFSQKAIQQSASYQTEMMKENSATDRSLGVAQIGSEGKVQSAQLSAQARVQAAQIQQQTRQMSQTFEQAAVAAEKSGDHAGAQRYYQAAQNIRQMGAQTTQQLVGVQAPNPGFDQQQPSMGAPAPGGAPAPQQAAPVPTAQGTTVVGDMEYRQMPDGSWQSRKVQK